MKTFACYGALGGALLFAVGPAPAAEPSFDSRVVTTDTPGHAVEVEVDVAGAKQLFLVVTDGGDGFACDWADWAEPRLVAPDGTETKITELPWESARADWGEVRVNRNANGGPLRIAGEPVAYGIGTHANSIIEYELPPGYVTFKARAGLDNGGTDQNAGRTTSVRFLVYLEKPPAHLGRAAAAAGGLAPDGTLAALDVAEGLEATLFAAEPMLVCPSNIDIDHRGRVWVCEAANYRHFANQDAPVREAGDRILILEDTTGDGRADTQTVFYQGRDIDSAMGICVLGNRVIVSCSPHVFLFTDETGDGKADRKELLFTKTGQEQHDHSAHAFVFGPDGRLYWNFGNTGHAVHDREGRLVIDLAGHEVTDRGRPYRQGMVFRCNLDGTDFEVLGHNFRNNYEVAVDSFGTLWQSDNDDDGNRGCRINFVMEYGNYGYVDELTGAGWQTPRTNVEEDIPSRHWHQNDPGVVPNLLQTGAGSPTGICVYEGDLLPEVFRGQMIHCDPGPNIVRAYPVAREGAGYKAEIVDLLHGAGDNWFRPADACVAPDGSVFVADWYDPGVGGHRFRAWEQGRIYRVAPPGHAYRVPEFDFTTPEGAVEALQNPNLAVRYLAWTALHEMQEQAEPALQALFRDLDPRLRARALWLLGRIEGRGPQTVAEAIADDDPDIRITGLRLARQLKLDLIPILKSLVRDPSPQVRRECAIALRHEPSAEMPGLWAELALQHDGRDRWYLEALGIAADRRWSECLSAWLAKAGTAWSEPAGRDIVWRSRDEAALPLLAQLILDPGTAPEARPRYFRAFDFHRPESAIGQALKQQTLIDLATADHADREEIAALALRHLGAVDLEGTPELKEAVERALDAARGTLRFVEIVRDLDLGEKHAELLALAQDHPDEQLGVAAIRELLARDRRPLIGEALRGEEVERAANTAVVLGHSADRRAAGLLQRTVHDEALSIEVRRQAARGLARFRDGAEHLVGLAAEQQIDASLVPAVAAALHAAAWPDVKQKAAELFPLPPAKNDAPLPPIEELVERRGDAAKGRVVYNTEGTCVKCHVVGDIGREVGPNLSEIGDKLSRHALYESILYPSAGISHNYETYVVLLEDGTTVNGLLTSRTAEEISLKSAEGIVHTFRTSEVEEIQKQDVSLMPADLHKLITVDELVDLVEYLTTLRKVGP